MDGDRASRMASPLHGRFARSRAALQRWPVALEFALQSIWSARRRMWLVVLGVAIGFGAIFSMLIIGGSVQAKIQSSLDSLGGDIVTLNINRPSSMDRDDLEMGRMGHRPSRLPGQEASEAVTLDALALLLGAMPGVTAVAPVYERTSCVSGRHDVRHLAVIQTTAALQDLLGLQWAQGRALTRADEGQNNLVVGSQVLGELRQQRPGIGLGSTVQACGRTYRIVGVLRSHPGSDFVQALQINQSALVVAAGEAQREDRGMSTQSWLLRLQAGADAQAMATQITTRVERLLPGYSVRADGAWAFIRSRQEQISLYSRFLAVLGSVALLVGALGITNMMLVTVAERRAEIGLRMAIGAQPQDIVIQFLCEGVLICLVGAVVGMLLGWTVASVALGLAGFEAVLLPSVVAQASLLAIGCGMVAGAYPARQAARLDPVSSLQG